MTTYHVRATHPDDADQEGIGADEYFECDVCGKDIRRAPKGLVLSLGKVDVSLHRHCIGHLIRALNEHRQPTRARDLLGNDHG